MNEPISIRERRPLHPSFNEQVVSNLVEKFYEKIAVDERLGPIFLSRNHGDWDDHLKTMKKFWSSVLMHSGLYKGQPVVKHNAIEEITTEDFAHWLVLFEETVNEVFDPDSVPIVMEVARRIANSLWLAKFGFAGANAPF